MTDETQNYYSPDDYRTMTYSQLKAWLACPSAARAQYVAKTYRPTFATGAVAIGALVDAMLLDPGDIDRVMEEHADSLHTKAGKPNADHLLALNMVEQARALPWLMALIDASEKQRVIRYTLGGFAWKGRLDLVSHEHCLIIDAKTCADPWKEGWVSRLGCRGNFIAERAYLGQLAMYQEGYFRETGDRYDTAILPLGKPTASYPQIDACLRPIDSQEDLDEWVRSVTAFCDVIHRYLEPGADIPRCDPVYGGAGDFNGRACPWCMAHRERCVLPYSEPRRRQQ